MLSGYVGALSEEVGDCGLGSGLDGEVRVVMSNEASSAHIAHWSSDKR